MSSETSRMFQGSLARLPASAWGFADQAVISGSNFGLMVLLARELGPEGFGLFILGYTALLFTNSIQSALFTGPHNVLGATRQGMEYDEYTRSTTLGQGIFSFTAGLLVGIVALAALGQGNEWSSFLLAVACAVVTWQLQEFLRRVFYTQGDYSIAFTNGLVTYGSQMAIIVILWQTSLLSATTAMIAVALSSGVGTVVGVLRLRSVLARLPNLHLAKAHWSDNWTFGRWLLGSSMASWTSGHLYPLLTAGFVGVPAAGGIRGTQTILGPTHVVLRSIDTMLPSRASRRYLEGGQQALQGFIRRSCTPVALAMLLYCGLSFLFAGPVVTVVLGQEYEEYAWFLKVGSVSYLLTTLSTVAGIYLRSAQVTKPILWAYVASGVMVLTVGVWLVAEYGLIGTAIGTLVHGLTVNIVLWWSIRNLATRLDSNSSRPKERFALFGHSLWGLMKCRPRKGQIAR